MSAADTNEVGSADRSGEISAAVRAAFESGQPLYINGGGSKRQLVGRDCIATTLEVGAHSGIVDYAPRELVLTARAGTPITELQSVLDAEGQYLAFEPPQFDGRATLGGTLACNLSGPGRPWTGSIRDMVLGVKIVSGTGEILRYGGQVMKNVAGYDVSRLQAGALGTLGVISEVSLKVLPRPEHSVTLRYELPADAAVADMNQRAVTPKPLTGACWIDGALYLRLSGADSAVRHTASQWGGDQVADDAAFWSGLRDMSLPPFAATEPVWRIACAANAPINTSVPPAVIDWGGAQRWLRGELEETSLRQQVEHTGGTLQLFAGGDRAAEVRGPVSAVSANLQRRLKNSFDPAGILNPGRLYSWL